MNAQPASGTSLPPTEQDPSDGDQLVEIDDRSLRFKVRPGSEPPTAKRPALLVCNGIGASLDVLDDFVEALSPERTIIRFDPPGVGGSPSVNTPYRLPALARSVMDACRQLGFERVDVLGYSWGGGLAQQIAVLHPKKCRRLVLIATSTGSLMVPGNPLALRRLLPARGSGRTGHLGRMAGEAYGGSARTPTTGVKRLLALQRTSTSARGYTYQLLAAAGWTSLGFLPLIRQRTLSMTGDDDPIIPVSNGKVLSSLIPRARGMVYPGGHIEIVARPDAFASIIEEFLDE